MRRNPYGFTVESELNVDAAQTRVRRLLKEEGLPIITEINVRKMLQENLGVDFREYRILGACDASIARRALEIEPSVGLMLLCNVVVEAKPAAGSAISFLDPMVALAMVGNPALREVASDAWTRLMRVAKQLTRRADTRERTTSALAAMAKTGA